MKSIKEMVKDNKKASFIKYNDSNLYYKTECGFVFPVTISDVGDGVFNATEKAMLLMRYIRKQIDKPEIEIIINSVEGNIRFVRFAKNQLIYTDGNIEFPIDVNETEISEFIAKESAENLLTFRNAYNEIIVKEKSK